MNNEQLLRYSRQIMLPQIDILGQQKIAAAKVLIIGAGGLGSPASMYLAAAGVGRITIVDDDVVDLSNLQRQIAHYTCDIGLDKVISTSDTLKKINPEVNVCAIKCRLQGKQLIEQVKQADIVLDCSDNFASRFAINAACVACQTALVSGAAIRFEGQVSVFASSPNDPCYNCLYPDNATQDDSCATNGIAAPVAGIVGSIQALETLKIIIGVGDTLAGRLLLFDGLAMRWHEVSLPKNPQCPTCKF